MKVEFYVSNRNGTFTKTTGYLLEHDLVAHKTEDGESWRLSDYQSGMFVKPGLHSLKECKEAVATIPTNLLEAVYKIRESEDYKKMCDKLHAFIKAEKGVDK